MNQKGEKEQKSIFGKLFSNKKAKSVNIGQILDPISPIRKEQSFSESKRVRIKFSKKMSIEELCENIKYLLKHLHNKSKIGYEQSVLNILNTQLQNYRLKINERFNFMMYLQPSIKFKQFSEIEEQVIKEWKRNPLLYSLQLSWISCVLKSKIQNPEDFQNQLEIQKHFISQLTYALFTSYFTILIDKDFPLMDRFIEETSVYIITAFTDWKKIYNEVILNFNNKEKQQEINFQFDLRSLGLGLSVIDFANHNSYPRTTQCIKQLSQQLKILNKIKLLKKMRHCLEEQIRQHQQKMIKAQVMNKYKIVEKDDFIGLTIYCIINGNIQNLSDSLRYFKILLGEEDRKVLSRWNVDCYRADLEASVSYLLQNSLISTLVKGVKQIQQ